jgi:hypothetical protein
MMEAVKLGPEEEALLALLRRADALGIAYMAIDCEEWGHAEMKAEMLGTLHEMCVEAEERFKTYKQELGLPDPSAYTDDQGGAILRGAPPHDHEEEHERGRETPEVVAVRLPRMDGRDRRQRHHRG